VQSLSFCHVSSPPTLYRLLQLVSCICFLPSYKSHDLIIYVNVFVFGCVVGSLSSLLDSDLIGRFTVYPLPSAAAFLKKKRPLNVNEQVVIATFIRVLFESVSK
jgi:hypothetical protein